MACSINLNNYVQSAGADLGGYFVLVGYEENSQLASKNDPNPDCIGTYIDEPIPVAPNVALGYTLGLNIGTTIVNFENVTPGFYGFKYIVGDANENGVFDNGECGEETCFEIEVVKGVDDCSDSISFCVNDVAAETNFDPTTMPNITEDCFSSFINPGDQWTFPTPAGNPITTTGANNLDLSGITTPGTYTAVYTIDGNSDFLDFHDVNTALCDNCTSVTTLTFVVSAAISAGTPNSFAVCN